MRFIRYLLVTVLFVGSAWYVSGIIGQLGQKKFTQVVEENSEFHTIDLGEIWESPAYKFIVPFQNPRPTPIEVQNIAASCNCSDISPRQFVIPANGEFRANATIDLTHRYEREIGKSTRSLTTEFIPIYTDNTIEASPLKFRGKIRSRVTANYLDLHFGDACVLGKPAASRKLTVQVHVPAREIRVRSEPNIVETTITAVQDRSNHYQITVIPNTKIDNIETLTENNGKICKAKLIISTVDDIGTEHFGTAIPISFQILSSPPIFSKQIFLPSAKPGETITTQLYPNYQPNDRYQIELVESSSDDVVAKITTGSSQRQCVAIQIFPNKAADVSRITVQLLNQNNQQRQRVPIDLIWATE